MKSLETNRGINTALVYAALEAGALLTIFPSIWMVFTNFRLAGESIRIPSIILPKQWMRENYLRTTAFLPIMKSYVSTVLPIPLQVLCAVVLSSTAGFAFAKLKSKGKNPLLSLVTVQMILPSQIFIIPQYQMLARMGLIDSMFVLAFPGLVSALGILFPRQAYMGIPDELGEVACLDGRIRWQALIEVAIPLTKTSMAAFTISTAMFTYTDPMWSLITNIDLDMMILSADLFAPRGQFITSYPALMTDFVLAMAPMAVLYLVFQEQFIGGTAMTGGRQKMEIETKIETDRNRYIQTEDGTW